jgi:hypothetical protein
MAGVNVDNVGLTYLHILDGVTETLNQASRFRNKVTQDYEWRGSHLEHKLHVARNNAIKFMNDGSTFPVANKQDYVSMKVGRRIVGGSIQLTDPVMATASKSPEVAMDVVASETEGLMKGILKFENFFYTRDGTGAVATVKTGTTGTDLRVDDARAMWDKGIYQVYDSTLATNRGNLVVSKTASALDANGNAQVTTTATVPSGTTSGDKIIWDGALNIAYTGLSALVDDAITGTFQSVTMSSYPRWTSLVLDNSGTARDLDPTLFRQLLAGILAKTGNEAPVNSLTAIGTQYQLNAMDELYESALRLAPSDKTSGTETPSFQSSVGRIDLQYDSDAPYGKIFLVDFSQIFRGVQKKLGWRVQNGQIFLRSDTAPVWTATALEICELYIKGRNSSGVIEDLTETRKTAY